jgi:hypothetical protein
LPGSGFGWRQEQRARRGAAGLVQNYFTDADPTLLLSELGLSEPEVTSPLEMSFAARAAEYQRLH